jgi:uncharacterized protein YbjT (DUF2867 family)
MLSPVTVIGGAGLTGRLVTSSLREHGAKVRVLTRDPRRARSFLPTDVSVYRADVRDSATLTGPLRDAAAVVVCVRPGPTGIGPDRPEVTAYQGVQRILRASLSWLGKPRLVLVSQVRVTRQDDSVNRESCLPDWGLRGEDAVRKSGLPYTVVRPGRLTNAPGGREGIRLGQGDAGYGSVSRADVAAVCVQALLHPAAIGLTFGVYNEASLPQGNWAMQFSGLRKDD